MSVTVTVDGRELALREGQDLLSACLTHGHDIPHFCWHGALGSIGACRWCAVRVHARPDDARGRIAMACMTPVAAGQRVAIADPEAQALRAAVIEWLMVKHPHDCPVCEAAGSCHLQDMTVAFGAHDRLWFRRAEDGPLESPFAGNLAEVCPTGVFNNRGWSNAYARNGDMRASPSVCPHGAVGCNLLVAERHGRVRRVQNRDHGAINGWFLCDRGRFGPLHVEATGGLRQARGGGREVDDARAMAAAREAIALAAVGIGAPRATLEGNHALWRLVGRDRFTTAVGNAEARLVRLMLEVLRVGPARIASLASVEAANAVLVLGEDLTGTAPRMALALRQAARGAERALAAAKGVPAFLDQAVRSAGEGRRSPIVLATPTSDALDPVARWTLRLDSLAIAALGEAAAAALGGRESSAEAREKSVCGHALAQSVGIAARPQRAGRPS